MVAETKTKKYCECGGLAGYLIKNGELICQSCGGISPRAKLVNGQFIKIGEKRIVCPKCGTVIQEERETVESTSVSKKKKEKK